MKINKITFMYINKQLYLLIFYDNEKFSKFKVKDKYKYRIFQLLADITVFDKYK